MKAKFLAVTMLFVMLFGAVFVPAQTVSAQSGVIVEVTGDLTDVVGGTFEGTFELTRFLVQDGQLVVQGVLNGELFDAVGNSLGEVTDFVVNLPVSGISATCEILDLQLGPLDLTLLGLNIFLDEVNLEITAEQGGGLLGDLLCSIADLLGNNSPLNPLVRLLNNVLRILG